MEELHGSAYDSVDQPVVLDVSQQKIVEVTTSVGLVVDWISFRTVDADTGVEGTLGPYGGSGGAYLRTFRSGTDGGRLSHFKGHVEVNPDGNCFLCGLGCEWL